MLYPLILGIIGMNDTAESSSSVVSYDWYGDTERAANAALSEAPPPLDAYSKLSSALLND